MQTRFRVIAGAIAAICLLPIVAFAAALMIHQLYCHTESGGRFSCMIFGQDVSETPAYLIMVGFPLSVFAIDGLFCTLLVWSLVEIVRVILRSTAKSN